MGLWRDIAGKGAARQDRVGKFERKWSSGRAGRTIGSPGAVAAPLEVQIVQLQRPALQTNAPQLLQTRFCNA